MSVSFRLPDVLNEQMLLDKLLLPIDVRLIAIAAAESSSIRFRLFLLKLTWMIREEKSERRKRKKGQRANL